MKTLVFISGHEVVIGVSLSGGRATPDGHPLWLRHFSLSCTSVITAPSAFLVPSHCLRLAFLLTNVS